MNAALSGSRNIQSRRIYSREPNKGPALQTRLTAPSKSLTGSKRGDVRICILHTFSLRILCIYLFKPGVRQRLNEECYYFSDLVKHQDSLVSEGRGEVAVLAAVFVVSVDEGDGRVAPLVRAQALHGHEHAVTHAARMPGNHTWLLRLHDHRPRFHRRLSLHVDASRWCAGLRRVGVHDIHVLHVSVGDSVHGNVARRLCCFLLSEERTEISHARCLENKSQKSAHQSCFYLIKNTVKTVKYYSSVNQLFSLWIYSKV